MTMDNSSLLIDYLLRYPSIVILLLSTSVAWFAWRSNVKIARLQRTLTLKQRTLDESHKSNFEVFREALSNLSKDELAQLAVKENIDLKYGKAVKEILNFYEDVSVGIRYKIYDEKFLLDTFGTTLVNVCAKALPFINAAQANSPRSYQDLSKLFKRWQKRIK